MSGLRWRAALAFIDSFLFSFFSVSSFSSLLYSFLLTVSNSFLCHPLLIYLPSSLSLPPVMSQRVCCLVFLLLRWMRGK